MTMLALLILGMLFLVLFYYYAIKPLSYWSDRGVTQGNPLTLFFNIFSAMFQRKPMTEVVTKLYNVGPGERYCGAYQFTIPTLVLKDPDILKQITVKDFDHFMDHRSIIPEHADPLWSKNLFALKGLKWREMRPILSPSFTSSKMRSMFVLMSECTENLVKHFNQMNEEVVKVEMKDIFTRFTNDVIATAAFGIKVDSLAEPKNEFYLMGKAATDFGGILTMLKFVAFMIIPGLSKIFTLRLFSKKVANFFTNIIDETVKLREEKHIVRPDMIHLLMEARKGVDKNEETEVMDTGFATVKEASIPSNIGNSIAKDLTNLDIAAQALIFFFAGFDSVSTLMCFVAYELAVNQDVQTRLREEIKQTQEDCKGSINYEALMKMTYLDMVISESLRKWPNAVVVDRVCTKPYTIKPERPNETPLHLDKDVVLWLPIYAVHRDPNNYDDPERFDPERFNEENKEKIKPYTYFPFGLGPRNCIGSRFALLETKMLFFNFLLNFEIIPIEKTIIPIKISKKTFNMTAEGGFWLGIKSITDSKNNAENQ